jgi:aspartate aminotransferase
MINQKNYELGSKSSAIRELFEYGKQRKQEIGEDLVYDFSIGNPSVESPSIVNETLVKLIQNTNPTILHGYTSAAGDLNVRKSIAAYLNDKYQMNTNESLIYLTVGAAASLTISLNALLNEGDEVIVFSPFFPEYKVFIESAKGIIKVVSPMIPSFQPSLIELEKQITKNTKVVIINSPNNPTGVIYNEETIKQIAEILNNKQKEFNQNIYILSDEPYRELVYSETHPVNIMKYYHNVLVCYSFSKSLSLPGERIGYIQVSEKCTNAKEVFTTICGSGRSLGFICAPSLFQYMIPNILGYTSNINVYKQNRDLLYNALTKIGYQVVRPEGAFYLFVKALEQDAFKFSEQAKKHELLIVPSDSFGYPGYVRISYCVKTEQIINAIPAFEKLYNDYK